MYCNGRGMATLLQQKNCMKSLSNGGVSGGGNNSANSTATSAVANTPLQQTRMLLPHECVNLPSIQNSNTALSSSSPVTSSGGGFVMTGITTTAHNLRSSHQNLQQNQLQFTAIQTPSNHNQFHSSLNLHQYNNNNFFSQFNHEDSNTIFLSTASTSNNNIKLSNINTTVTSPISSSSIVTSAITSHDPIYQQSHRTTTANTSNILNSTVGNLPGSTITTNSIAGSHTEYLKTDQSAQHDGLVNSNDIPSGTAINSNQCNNADEKNCDTNNSPTAQIQENGNEEQVEADEQEPEPEIDIVINNVVCSFSVRCHLNLREIALNGFNVEFRRQNAMVTMKLRRPYTTASIWSSGRITCTGATSEDQAKIAARRYARCLQKLGFRVRFHNFRVVNVLGTCSMPWAIKIVNFSEKYKKEASYEPELHPGVTYKIKNPKATMKIFSTGSITVTASSVANVQTAIEHIYPLVYEFRKKRTRVELELLRSKRLSTDEIAFRDEDEFADEEDELHSRSAKRKRPLGRADNDPTENIMIVSENEDFEEGDDVEVY